MAVADEALLGRIKRHEIYYKRSGDYTQTSRDSYRSFWVEREHVTLCSIAEIRARRKTRGIGGGGDYIRVIIGIATAPRPRVSRRERRL